MVALIAQFVFFLIVGLKWVFGISFLYDTVIVGIAALVLAVIYFLALIGRPVVQ